MPLHNYMPGSGIQLYVTNLWIYKCSANFDDSNVINARLKKTMFPGSNSMNRVLNPTVAAHSQSLLCPN
jgi:hypothetical protein